MKKSWLLGCFLGLATACGGGGTSSPTSQTQVGSAVSSIDIGEPCTPVVESFPDFGGFDEQEVTVETDSPTRVCLVNHFRGRVSCPQGQPRAATGCFVEGTTSPVTVPVAAQCATR